MLFIEPCVRQFTTGSNTIEKLIEQKWDWKERKCAAEEEKTLQLYTDQDDLCEMLLRLFLFVLASCCSLLLHSYLIILVIHVNNYVKIKNPKHRDDWRKKWSREERRIYLMRVLYGSLKCCVTSKNSWILFWNKINTNEGRDQLLIESIFSISHGQHVTLKYFHPYFDRENNWFNLESITCIAVYFIKNIKWILNSFYCTVSSALFCQP